jgi:hypothetical protein
MNHEISEGSVTSVYLAVQEGGAELRKPVAVKRLRQETASDPALGLDLAREAHLLAQVNHRNVVPALDFIESGAESSLVMEYVLGDNLANLIHFGGRCPVPVAVAIVVDTLHGLHGAHTACDGSGRPLGIVHGNVCPENILVGVDGVARVIDFGSAISTLRSLDSSRPGSPLHSVAPEHIVDQAVDGRADLFAAAVVLWHTLTGKRPPLDLTLRDTPWGQVARELPLASTFNPEVPPMLDSIIERALQSSPKDRFDTAADFAFELQANARPAVPAAVAEYLERAEAGRLAFQRSLLTKLGFGAPSTELVENFEPDEPTLRLSEEQVLMFPAAAAPGRPALRLAEPPRQSTKPPPHTRETRPESVGVSTRSVEAEPENHALVWAARGRAFLRRPAPMMVTGLLLGFALFTLVRVPFRASAAATPQAPLEHSLAAFAPVAARAAEPPPLQPTRSFDIDEPFPRADGAAETTASRGKAIYRKSNSKQKATRASCDPPFRFDASGIKRIKRKCI